MWICNVMISFHKFLPWPERFTVNKHTMELELRNEAEAMHSNNRTIHATTTTKKCAKTQPGDCIFGLFLQLCEYGEKLQMLELLVILSLWRMITANIIKQTSWVVSRFPTRCVPVWVSFQRPSNEEQWQEVEDETNSHSNWFYDCSLWK